MTMMSTEPSSAVTIHSPPVEYPPDRHDFTARRSGGKRSSTSGRLAARNAPVTVTACSAARCSSTSAHVSHVRARCQRFHSGPRSRCASADEVAASGSSSTTIMTPVQLTASPAILAAMPSAGGTAMWMSTAAIPRANIHVPYHQRSRAIRSRATVMNGVTARHATRQSTASRPRTSSAHGTGLTRWASGNSRASGGMAGQHRDSRDLPGRLATASAAVTGPGARAASWAWRGRGRASGGVRGSSPGARPSAGQYPGRPVSGLDLPLAPGGAGQRGLVVQEHGER